MKSQGLTNKQIDALYPRVTHCAANKKKILFPSSFWGIFDFFVFFNNFGKSIKECYVTKEEACVANILVSSTRNAVMLREKGHIQEKDTREKSSRGQRCQDTEAKCYRACI
jgi:hypothetical protein